MARPYLKENQSDRLLDLTFLEFIKDKPFYSIKGDGTPLKIGGMKGDELGDFYYVGELMGGNAIFDPKSRVNVYYFDKYLSDSYQKQETIYWVHTIISNFRNSDWTLVDWYKNGVTYEDAIKHLPSIKDFNPFGDINESKQLTVPIKPGMPIYCHTSVEPYNAGEWYKIAKVEYRAGQNGEDVIRIYDGVDESSISSTWTIQKDENDLNYENWFSIGDTTFDTHKAFDDLYESDLEWAKDLVNSEPIGWDLYRLIKFYLDGNKTIGVRYDDDGEVCITDVRGGAYICVPIDELTLRRIKREFFDVIYGHYGYDIKEEYEEAYEILKPIIPPSIITDNIHKREELNESENDDLGWAHDIANSTINGWELLKSGIGNLKNFKVRLIIKDYDYLMCSLGTCGDGLHKLILNQPDYEFQLLDFDRHNLHRVDVDCGCGYDDGNDGNDDIVTAVNLRYNDGGYINNFWFLEEWVDLILIPKNINESEDDSLEWAEDTVKSVDIDVDAESAFHDAKIMRGRDWKWGEQDYGTLYGKIIDTNPDWDNGEYARENKNGLGIQDYTAAGVAVMGSPENQQKWVRVLWYDKRGRPIDENSYRAGPDYFDLKYYIEK